MKQVPVILLDPSDEVATCLADVDPGSRLALLGGADTGVISVEHVPFGHKIAMRDVASAAHVRKYGTVIGVATQAISAGQHVHEHNLKSLRAG
jgi:hypothetical protein